MKDATVVFDLDGTMIDTAPDLIAATNFTLGRFGMIPVSAGIIQPAVGFGARAMIEAAMADHGRKPGADEVSRMTDVFIDYYRDHIAEQSQPFPGLVEALDALQDAGARLAVCTNKREELALKLLAALKLDGYFAAIAGADTFPVRKPDGGHILRTIAQAGGDPARAVMIGDSSADSRAARDAKLPFIAVGFGYGEPVEMLAPDAVIQSFAELLPAVRDLLPPA
ncbi:MULTISPECIES: HAD-IA family hydrolase [Rhodomicrobium]|uniref:HAD-IA family hydrolase n=1 Tax=Rhodomicrobium TaxID=1068 RepID=UPI000B4BC15A|nr:MULTISPECIES: HAD-IA family hydrolase [Rhodomicrobium]